MTKEILGYSARLRQPERSLLANPRRAISAAYACAEALWYFSGSDEVAPIAKFAPQYVHFGEDDGRAHGAYGKRLRLDSREHQSALHCVVDVLRAAPHSRQAEVTLWTDEDLKWAVEENAKRDLPCTVSMQFLLRNNQLTMIVYMRSNDVWLGLPYDVFCFTLIQRVVAAELGVGLGDYVHKVGSLHLYEKHWDAVNELRLNQEACTAESARLSWTFARTTITSLQEAGRLWLHAVEVSAPGAYSSREYARLCYVGRTLFDMCMDALLDRTLCDSKALCASHQQWLSRRGT